MVDFDLTNHGSLYVLVPLTNAAEDWIVENLPEDAQTWAGGIVIEPRYLEPILQAIDDAGLTIT